MNDKKASKNVAERISNFLLILTVISISLEKRAVPFLIFFYVISLFFNKKFYSGFINILKKNTLQATSYYLLLILAVLYSENKDSAYFDLEVKFSLFLFPVVFSTMDLSRKQFYNILLSYIGGCFLAFSICLSMAIIYFFSSFDPSVFYYDKLSVFHHPTYFSMYLNFAIIILYYFLIYAKEDLKYRSDFILILLITVFSIFVVLLSSKMGLITLLAIIFGGTVLWFLRSRAVFPSILVFLMVSSLIYISFKYSTSIQDRISEAVKSISEEEYSFSTTSARIAIWEVSLDLIQDKPLIGYGTGDVKDELLRVYADNDYKFLLYKRLNCHNQYLQAGIAAGIPGIIIFLFSIFYPVRKIFQTKYMIYGGFLFLVSVNFLTESVLETQAGVVFYALFNSFLYFNIKNIRT